MYLHKILQALLYLTDRLLSKQQALIQTTGSYPNDGLLSVLKYVQQTFTYRTADMNAEENDTKSLYSFSLPRATLTMVRRIFPSLQEIIGCAMPCNTIRQESVPSVR